MPKTSGEFGQGRSTLDTAFRTRNPFSRLPNRAAGVDWGLRRPPASVYTPQFYITALRQVFLVMARARSQWMAPPSLVRAGVMNESRVEVPRKSPEANVTK